MLSTVGVHRNMALTPAAAAALIAVTIVFSEVLCRKIRECTNTSMYTH
jgi:hypothetical protein